MHLSDDEFWDLTLVEFNALAERLNARIKLENYRVGLICATVINGYVDPKKHRAFTANDFFPGCIEEKPQIQEKQSPAQMLEILKSWQSLYDKNDKRLKH